MIDSCKMVQNQSEVFHTFLWHFFPSLKHDFIVYCSSKVSSCPDCIFEIHQLWQSGFSIVYSNCCCSCSFEAEIIKLVSHLIRCIAITYWIFKSLQQFWMPVQKKVWKLIEGTTFDPVWTHKAEVLNLVHLVCYLCSFQITLWSNAQWVNTPFTVVLPTAAGTCQNLNWFGHVTYTAQTSIYQNIAYIWIHPSIIIQFVFDCKNSTFCYFLNFALSETWAEVAYCTS